MRAVFVGLEGVYDNMCGEELWVCWYVVVTEHTAHVLREYKCTHTERERDCLLYEYLVHKWQ